MKQDNNEIALFLSCGHSAATFNLFAPITFCVIGSSTQLLLFYFKSAVPLLNLSTIVYLVVSFAVQSNEKKKKLLFLFINIQQQFYSK